MNKPLYTHTNKLWNNKLYSNKKNVQLEKNIIGDKKNE